MSWGWSHSTQDYEDAKQNLAGLPLKHLYAIYGEWKVKQSLTSVEDGFDGTGGWDDPTYQRSLKEAKGLPIDVLVDYIWSKADEQRTCTNGGWDLWLCPYGCGSHMVPTIWQSRLLRAAQKRGL